MIAVFAVTSLRRVVEEVHQKVGLAEVKERQFTQMALRFAMVGADFYRAKQSESMRDPRQLVQQLNNIRSILAQLQATPLTATETEGVTNCGWKSDGSAPRSTSSSSPASTTRPETAAKAVKDIEVIIDDAVDRAIFYAYRTSEVIETANGQILRSAKQTQVALTVGAVVAAIGPASS